MSGTFFYCIIYRPVVDLRTYTLNRKIKSVLSQPKFPHQFLMYDHLSIICKILTLLHYITLLEYCWDKVGSDNENDENQCNANDQSDKAKKLMVTIQKTIALTLTTNKLT